MKQLITTIESTEPSFVVDFPAVKKELTKQLKKYDVVVTADTVGDAKKLATDLNKQKTEIDARRKEAVYNVSAPIRAFDADMKHLVKMCEDGRAKINFQVKTFEDKTKNDVLVLLHQLRTKF